MNDGLISRKAAIDEVKRLADVAWANWKETRISANTMIYALKDLPSAQPEIIRCKDCKHYKAYDYTGSLACHLIIGVTVRRDLNDFCSRAERQNNAFR
jgi:hypothetical protein